MRITERPHKCRVCDGTHRTGDWEICIAALVGRNSAQDAYIDQQRAELATLRADRDRLEAENAGLRGGVGEHHYGLPDTLRPTVQPLPDHPQRRRIGSRRVPVPVHVAGTQEGSAGVARGQEPTVSPSLGGYGTPESNRIRPHQEGEARWLNR